MLTAYHDNILAEEAFHAPCSVLDSKARSIRYVRSGLGRVVAVVRNWEEDTYPKGKMEGDKVSWPDTR